MKLIRVTRLEVHDILGARDVDLILPADEPVHIITGPNGGGKSSALDALMIAMVDAGGHPSEPVRRGASKGVVRVTFDDGMVVTRTLRRGRAPQLEVVAGDGEPCKRPQRSVLDKLWSKISWDPTEVYRMPDKELRIQLMRLAGIDWTALEDEAGRVYKERTIINRDVDKARALLDAMPAHADAPDEPWDTEALIAELQRRLQHNGQGDDLQRVLEEATDSVEDRELSIIALEKELLDLQNRLKLQRGHLAEERRAAQAAQLAAEQHEPADVAEIEQQLARSREVNAAVLAKRQREAKAEELRTLETESAKATARLKAIKAEKQRQLEAAKFPVEGLSFSDEGVLYHGLPFAQAEESARLRVSVAIGLKLNPRMPTMICRYGGGLDASSIELLKGIVAEGHGQLLLEHPWVPPEKSRGYIREGVSVGPEQLELGK